MASKQDTKAIGCRLTVRQIAALAAEGIPSKVLKRLVEKHTGIPYEYDKLRPGRPKKANNA